MPKKMSILFPAVFLAACVSVSGPPAANEDRTRVYDGASYSRLFEAAMATFLQLGADITVLDEDHGLLSGKVRLTSELHSSLWGRTRMIYTYYDATFAHTESGGIMIQLRIVTSYEDGFMPSEGDKTDYDKFWNLVNRNL
jgi:hypothetical protein